MVQFSQKEYMVDESTSYAKLKVIITGQRYLPISFNYKVFVSNTEFQPYPGLHYAVVLLHVLMEIYGINYVLFTMEHFNNYMVCALIASRADVQTGTFFAYVPGNLNVVYIKVRIFDDILLEGTEAFGVQLSIRDHHKANGLRLGDPSNATVFIKDGNNIMRS